MLVSVDELVEYLGGYDQLTDARQEHIEHVILPGIQSELENYLRRPVELTHVREQLAADQEGYIWFTVTPVVDIVSVTRSDGDTISIPRPKPQPIPPMADIPIIERKLVLPGVGLGAYPYKLYVGPLLFNVPSLFLTQAPVSYLAEYIGGIDGTSVPGLKMAILRVAAREVEKQFDETLSLRGGATEAASNSDDRPKFWTQEELEQWDTLRKPLVF